MANKRKVKFVRIRGRIVPISLKKEGSIAKELVSSKNRLSIAKIGAATLGSLAIATGAGRLFTISQKIIKSGAFKRGFALEKFSKISKFGATALPALVVTSELRKIDRKTREEGSRFFNLGSKGTGLNIAIALGGGLIFHRFKKRFEVFGRTGKFNFKRLKDF